MLPKNKTLSRFSRDNKRIIDIESVLRKIKSVTCCCYKFLQVFVVWDKDSINLKILFLFFTSRSERFFFFFLFLFPSFPLLPLKILFFFFLSFSSELEQGTTSRRKEKCVKVRRWNRDRRRIGRIENEINVQCSAPSWFRCAAPFQNRVSFFGPVGTNRWCTVSTRSIRSFF